MTKTSEDVEGLNIQLHGVDVAIVTHYAGGKNILTFNPAFITTSQHERLTFSLRQRRDPQYLHTPQIRTDKLPPVLSNLLPEGALRDVVSQALQCHTNNEFAILAYMGKNLPGAIVATPIKAGELPRWALAQRLSTAPQQIDVKHADNKFSLAGVQMKFSSSHRDGRYHIDHDANEDSWIIKTPSTVHKGVPLNEFTCMTLAAQAGAVVPEIRLINVAELEGLPNIQLPNEPFAYGIQRFDRGSDGRIHAEDFAQVFGLYPSDKYQKVNYEQLGKVLYRESANGREDIQQMARRLLINILLGNGDAHLKNWTICYPDRMLPRLAPLYDVVFTQPYIEYDNIALKMAKSKRWYDIGLSHFERWSQDVGVPWQMIKPHLLDTINLARDIWPNQLAQLPMLTEHKAMLRDHWKALHEDFTIDS